MIFIKVSNVQKYYIQFAGIPKSKTEMWLLGCGVILQTFDASEVNDSLAERVGKILQDSGVPLSEGAENCRKLILSQQDLKV